MLTLFHASFAKVEELFNYKYKGFSLPSFPGYTNDQWGIKAHNRAWIEEVGNFSIQQKILEVGGAYSLLPKYLADKYDLEAWIGDDFGSKSDEEIWSRWGDPFELPKKYENVNYVFERFGCFSKCYPDDYFDRIFSVSTLEHVQIEKRIDVIKDINRCLRPGGIQLHTIDIRITSIKNILWSEMKDRLVSRIPFMGKYFFRTSEIYDWITIFRESGIKIVCKIPTPIQLLEVNTLAESPDVVYRFYPPNDAPKPYQPCASLLLMISKE